MRGLYRRAADLVLGLGWALAWRLGRSAGRAAVIALTCPECDARLQCSLAQAGKAMRLHDRAHILLDRIEAAKGGIPDTLPEGWTR